EQLFGAGRQQALADVEVEARHHDADAQAGAGEVGVDLGDTVVARLAAGVFGLVALHGVSCVQFLSTKPVISRPKPAMLGILRGLASSRILPTLSARRIWAPTPKMRASHFTG